MKKWLSLIIIGSLLVFSSTAMAHGKGKGHEEKHGKSMKECKEITGLLKALEKVKNPKAKAAIQANINKLQEKCEKENDGGNQVLTDAQRVSADQAALKIGFAGGNRTDWITGAIQLPVKGKNGSAITWSLTNRM